MKKQDIKEKEKQHADCYARIPSQASEFEEWESEQVWLEYDEGEPEAAIRQTAVTGERTKLMEKALEKAAEIRNRLEGRHHSDSTQLLREDRQQ